jgi:hypothetical protein
LAPPYDSKNNAKKSKGTTAKAMMGKRRWAECHT